MDSESILEVEWTEHTNGTGMGNESTKDDSQVSGLNSWVDGSRITGMKITQKKHQDFLLEVEYRLGHIKFEM